ncbi:MAG: STAS domain-containing protein [Pirellulales bacterium]|nr:STAS domain-containing protein [Pirellulales bacterium]
MPIRHELSGEVRVIIIDEARLLEGSAIEQCYREILEVLDKTEESNVLLHFGRVTFMSSAALGVLIRINKKCKEYQVALKLCGIAPEIGQVFKITGLDKVFDIQPDLAKAMEAFQKAGQLYYRKRRPKSYEVT